MTKGERLVGEAALCALYLRGAPSAGACSRKRWPLVADALRSCAPSVGDASDALRSRGLYDEAAALDFPGAMGWALDLLSSGGAFTFLDPCYPSGWVASLGAGAPPCCWVRGPLPGAGAVAIVGSRSLGVGERSFVAGASRLLMRSGSALVSGGACGADSVAVDAALAGGGAGRCVVLLPHGLSHVVPLPGVTYVSCCEPWAGFTTGQAMERNALIYSFGRRAVVVAPRLRAGGTWHGAVDALRRRLGQVVVRGGDGAAALCRLGALECTGVAALPALLSAPVVPAQPELFGPPAVRTPSALYA